MNNQKKLKLVSLTQGSDEWKEYRRTRVGGSDFPIIASNQGLCKNIFSKSITSLIDEKTNGEKKDNNSFANSIFKAGLSFEERILSRLKLHSTARGEVVEFDENPLIYASLDARDLSYNSPIEIKTTSKSGDNYNAAIEYYRFQLAHQCHVIGSESGIMAVAVMDEDRKNILDTKVYNVVASEVISKEEWLRLCLEFISKLDQGNNAPEDDIAIIDRIRQIRQYIKELEDSEEELKKAVLNKYDKGCNFRQFKISSSTRSILNLDSFLESIGLNKDSIDKRHYKSSTTKRLIISDNNIA